MRFSVAVTNNDWFNFLSSRPREEVDEVNFWRPRSQNRFGAIPVGAPFLFKLHAPLDFIVGGGFFLKHTLLPIDMVWQTFGWKNGAADYSTFKRRILGHRTPDELGLPLGCTVLAEPFFFPRSQWIRSPASWSANIVTGRGYDTADAEGARLWGEVRERLDALEPAIARDEDGQGRYGDPQLFRPRLGQGGFRVLVTEAYDRRCAVTRERTLPALEAAHIKPFAECGPHAVGNGLLLRSDLHKLFDAGYVTVTRRGTDDYRLLVSPRIRQEFENGRDYYRMHDSSLWVPPDPEERPDQKFLAFHNEERFLS